MPTSVVSNQMTERVGSVAAARRYMSTLSYGAIQRLRKWALFRQPNYWYIFANGLQVLTCVAVLVVGMVCIQEARADLKANVSKDTADNTSAVNVHPCGYPAPDMLHLLRLQGVYESGLGLPQLIEPDYESWNLRVQGSLCATDPYWDFAGNDGGRDAVTEEKAQLLRGLATITHKTHLQPRDETNAANLLKIETEMLNDMCNTKANRSYSKRLETAFGDPFTRIARAYLAAAPAFRAYELSKGTSRDEPSCLGNHDPFGYDASGTSVCGNGDYVTLVLQRAGSWANSARLAGVEENDAKLHTDIWNSNTAMTSGPLEMLYALYALSVINHIDKSVNKGNCFRNKAAETAIAICEDLYSDMDGLLDTVELPTLESIKAAWGTKVFDVNYYKAGDHPISHDYSCLEPTISGIILTTSEAVTTPSPPAPPPFMTHRGAESARFATILLEATSLASNEEVRQHTIGSCAATMQYGLYDQERLFGVPDVLRPFQHDNRPDASLHFLGGTIAKWWYLDPLGKMGSASEIPAVRLELYLAYRLAALSLWGSLVAVVTGYFIGRSGVPLGASVIAVVLQAKNPRGRSVTIVQPEARSIYQDFFTLIAAITALLVAYYTIFVDPSAQSYYPTTPECDDFILTKSPHSSGGAYVTSWGKRRFNRYSEAILGVVLVAVAAVPLFYSATKILVQSRAKFKKSKRIGISLLGTSINAVFLVCALTIIGAQAANCINSGNKWLNEAVLYPHDTSIRNDRLSRDCLAMVLVSFWNGLAFAVNRANWVVRQFKAMVYHYAFFGGCVFTVSLSLLSYLTLLPDEFEASHPFSITPPADGHRYRAQWVMFSALGVYGVAVVVEFLSIMTELKGSTDAGGEQEVALMAGKTNVEAAASTRSAFDAGGGFFKLETVHVDPRALLSGAAPAPPQTRAAAATVLSRLPLSSEQRRVPIGTRSRGQYAPMTATAAPMPHLNLRH